MKWTKMRFGEVCDYRTGKLDSNAAVDGGAFPFFTCAPVPRQIDTYEFDQEAVLLGGNNADGRFPLNYYVGKFNAYQRTYVISSKSDSMLLSRFLYYQLSLCLSHLRQVSTGTATKYLTKPILDRLSLTLPPLPTQRRIADILSAYDDLIENNKRRMALLEESIHRLYREWFVHLRFPGHERVKVVDGVPEGWERVPFGELVDSITDRVHPRSVSDHTPYLGLEHLPKKSLAVSDWGRAADVSSSKLEFREGDIIFGKIRPYFHKVVVAPVSGISSSDSIVLRSVSSALKGLAIAVASSEQFVEYAYQTGNPGSKMPRANWKTMSQYPVLRPPSRIATEFSETVNVAISLLHNLLFHNRQLSQARDALLPRLMNGSLMV